MGKGKSTYMNAPSDLYGLIDEQGVRFQKIALYILRFSNSQLIENNVFQTWRPSSSCLFMEVFDVFLTDAGMRTVSSLLFEGMDTTRSGACG